MYYNFRAPHGLHHPSARLDLADARGPAVYPVQETLDILFRNHHLPPSVRAGEPRLWLSVNPSKSNRTFRVQARCSYSFWNFTGSRC